MAGNSTNAPVRTPTGANGSGSTVGLRRVGVAMAGTSVGAAVGPSEAPRRPSCGEGRVATVVGTGSGTTPGGGATGSETPGFRRGAARALRRTALVESNPVAPAPEAGGLP